jgi:hypothetical protein
MNHVSSKFNSSKKINDTNTASLSAVYQQYCLHFFLLCVPWFCKILIPKKAEKESTIFLICTISDDIINKNQPF